MAVGDIVSSGGAGCLVDRPVEIGSTVATADSIALGSVHRAARGILWGMLVPDLDLADTGEHWPQ